MSVNAKYNVDLNLLRPRRVAGMAPCLGVVARSDDAAACSTTIGRGNDGGDRPRSDDLLLEIDVHMMWYDKCSCKLMLDRAAK